MIYTLLRVLLVSSFLFSINSKIDQLQEESKFQEALKLCEDNYNDNDVELLWRLARAYFDIADQTSNIDIRSYSAYIRLEVKDISGVLTNVTKVFSKNKVSIKRIIQSPYNSKKNSRIVIITHNSNNRLLSKTINILAKKKFVITKPKFIRIEYI